MAWTSRVPCWYPGMPCQEGGQWIMGQYVGRGPRASRCGTTFTGSVSRRMTLVTFKYMQQRMPEPLLPLVPMAWKKEGKKNALVFDLGGGTLDVLLFAINNGAFGMVTTNGDTILGGEDFNQRVMSHFIKLYKEKKRKDPMKDVYAVQKLRGEVEKLRELYLQLIRLVLRLNLCLILEGILLKWPSRPGV